MINKGDGRMMAFPSGQEFSPLDIHTSLAPVVFQLNFDSAAGMLEALVCLLPLQCATGD
jgi:hypothetical protein